MTIGYFYIYGRMILKAMLLCSLLLIVIVSCKKDDTVAARPVPQCFITESLASDKAQFFSYDNQNRLTKIVNLYADPTIKSDTSLFYYSADKRLAKTYYTDNSGTTPQRLYDTLIYDDNKDQITINTYYPNSSNQYNFGSSKIAYKNGTNSIQKLSNYYMSNGSLVYDGAKIYQHDNKGNVTKISLLDANADTVSTLSSSFDNKTNPQAYLAYTFLYDLLESPNNPTSSTLYYPSIKQSFTHIYDMRYSITNVPDTVITRVGSAFITTAYQHICH